MKVSVYIATSLDGFIARRDGSIDWLNEAQGLIPEGEDCGFKEFMDSVDVLVIGRKTFEQVLSFGQWPYGQTKMVVLSHNTVEIPDNLPPCVSCSSEPPQVLLERLSEQGAKHAYVDGGKTIHSFLAESLIDEFIITRIPILIGDGIPLFDSIQNDIQLEHIHTTAFDFGLVQSTYRVKKD